MLRKIFRYLKTGVTVDGKSSIGAHTYIGRFTDIQDSSIGKFCSIGPGCKIGLSNHNLKSVTTHPFINNKSFGFVKNNYYPPDEKELTRKELIINNDVWLGSNVIVLRGVTIGDGSVIGAGAIVVKDIPPYAIAVGNPARVVGYRFSDEQINQLLKIKWWDWSDEKLRMCVNSFYDINGFIEKFSSN